MNHMLREDSEEEEKKVLEFSKKHGFEIEVKRANIRRMNTGCENLESFSRKVRYEFFLEVMNKYNFNKISTAHTLDDLVETFFMHLLRGSGLEGMRSILPLRDGVFIRPVLFIKKSEIIEYLKGLGIEYVEDSENSNLDFLRNRVRHTLIPLIEKIANPSIKETIKSTIDVLREEDEFINGVSIKRFKENFSNLELNLINLRREHPAIQRRVVRLYLKELFSNLWGITFYHVEALRTLREGKIFEIKKNKRFTVENGKLKLLKDEGAIFSPFYVYENELPMSIDKDNLKLKIRFLRDSEKINFNDLKRAYIKYTDELFPIFVRRRVKGDRYTPIGLSHSKKLKKVFMEKRIPKRLRERVPVFLSKASEILWAPGIPVNEKYKIKAENKRIVVIEVEKF